MYKIGDTFEYNNGRGEVVYYIVKRVQPHAMSEMRYACDCIKDGVSLYQQLKYYFYCSENFFNTYCKNVIFNY